MQAPATASLPSRLTDGEFWRLIEAFSEPNGFFRSENLVSNEDTFQFVIPDLQRIVKPTAYIWASGPIRTSPTSWRASPHGVHHGRPPRQLAPPLDVQGAHRARGRPRRVPLAPVLAPASARPDDRLGSRAVLRGLLAGGASRDLYEETFRAIIEVLRTRHGFPLDDEDVAGVGLVYGSFYAGGPNLAYASGGGFGRGRYPTYQDLQMANDGQGTNRAYLATEDNFRVLKAMQHNNLIVPVVGNFAGARALRSVGAYPRSPARRSRRSTPRTSSSTCSRIGSGPTSRATSPRCRSTTAARSSAAVSTTARRALGIGRSRCWIRSRACCAISPPAGCSPTGTSCRTAASGLRALSASARSGGRR